MGKRRRYSDEQLQRAVEENTSIRGVLMALGLAPLGGNYVTIHRRVAELKLSTEHWLGCGHLRGKTHNYNPPRPLLEILKPGTRYQTHKLRRRLVAEGLMRAECSGCGLDQWLGAPIPLELDHIDGDIENNSIGNLRLLCPNCHALTPTYRGKNTKYAHIPPLADILKGIDHAGDLASYAAEMGVSRDVVRGWLRSERLRRLSRVTQNTAVYLH
jgi:hypothetical protein